MTSKCAQTAFSPSQNAFHLFYCTFSLSMNKLSNNETRWCISELSNYGIFANLFLDGPLLQSLTPLMPCMMVGLQVKRRMKGKEG